MMPILLLLYYLVLPPNTPVYVCALWVSQPPSETQAVEACGMLDWAGVEVQFRALRTGEIMCSAPGMAIFAPGDFCNLPGSLDAYRMEVITYPQYDQIICTIQSPNDPPVRDEITSACGLEALAQYDRGEAILRPMGEIIPPVPAAPVCAAPLIDPGTGLFEQPSSATELATAEPLQLLAGRLIWYGLVTPDCNGWSGVDMSTGAATPCGMQFARPLVAEWQNRYDQEIYAAALEANVPARLLKFLLLAESQAWPLAAGHDGEISAYQVTDAALDTWLRYSNQMPEYPALDETAQLHARAVWRNRLACAGCSLWEADQRLRENMPIYARILAAYRCRAQTTAPASPAESWRNAAAGWNDIYREKLQ